jgi:hypothetical protein
MVINLPHDQLKTTAGGLHGSLVCPQPNYGLQATAASVRSCLAPAFSRA